MEKIGYGTGAVMAVPAHDVRDYDFARKFGLEVKEVVSGGDVETEAYVGDGVMMGWNGAWGLDLDGMQAREAKGMLKEFFERKKGAVGRWTVKYKLRDWLFSRQRYWGEPFPVVFVEGEEEVAKGVRVEDLPVTLPEVESFKPTGTGEPPLAAVKSWVETVDATTGKPARRETNTMPQWAGSCW